MIMERKLLVQKARKVVRTLKAEQSEIGLRSGFKNRAYNYFTMTIRINYRNTKSNRAITTCPTPKHINFRTKMNEFCADKKTLLTIRTT
jgi:hypothetical protein